MFAALHAPAGTDAGVLLDIGRAFSPRVESHPPREVVLDLDGLTRLFGDARTIGQEIRRTAADRGLQLRVAIAGSRTAARLLVRHRAGLTLASPDGEMDPAGDRQAVAELPLEVLAELWTGDITSDATPTSSLVPATAAATSLGRVRPPAQAAAAAQRQRDAQERVRTLRRWGLRTLADVAALPPDDIAARLGADGAAWWHMARGEDLAPLVPSSPEECFEEALELEWPIEGLEPLSFVLGRLLDPLAARLERRDRGVAVLHLRLHLVTKAVHALSLQLPTPMREPKALRTLLLLALESTPPPAAIDRVVVAADPTPGRVLQHSLLARPVPMAEELATLTARLTALMGEGRCGSPAVVDTWRPGAFSVAPFAPPQTGRDGRSPAVSSHVGGARGLSGPAAAPAARAADPAQAPALALRRFRAPVPARVTVERGRPVLVATDRRGLGGGRVTQSAGPWRTSGHWWDDMPAGAAAPAVSSHGSALASVEVAATATASASMPARPAPTPWDRDEWDVTLADGATYRVFTERGTRAWFVDGVFD